MSDSPANTTRKEWLEALDALPSTPNHIPAFFFGHGSPILAFSDVDFSTGRGSIFPSYAGPHGPLSAFLKDFGPALLTKYQPKGIVVFSAHWETSPERLGEAST